MGQGVAIGFLIVAFVCLLTLMIYIIINDDKRKKTPQDEPVVVTREESKRVHTQESKHSNIQPEESKHTSEQPKTSPGQPCLADSECSSGMCDKRYKLMRYSGTWDPVENITIDPSNVVDMIGTTIMTNPSDNNYFIGDKHIIMPKTIEVEGEKYGFKLAKLALSTQSDSKTSQFYTIYSNQSKTQQKLLIVKGVPGKSTRPDLSPLGIPIEIAAAEGNDVSWFDIRESDKAIEVLLEINGNVVYLPNILQGGNQNVEPVKNAGAARFIGDSRAYIEDGEVVVVTNGRRKRISADHERVIDYQILDMSGRVSGNPSNIYLVKSDLSLIKLENNEEVSTNLKVVRGKDGQPLVSTYNGELYAVANTCV